MWALPSYVLWEVHILPKILTIPRRLFLGIWFTASIELSTTQPLPHSLLSAPSPSTAHCLSLYSAKSHHQNTGHTMPKSGAMQGVGVSLTEKTQRSSRQSHWQRFWQATLSTPVPASCILPLSLPQDPVSIVSIVSIYLEPLTLFDCQDNSKFLQGETSSSFYIFRFCQGIRESKNLYLS